MVEGGVRCGAVRLVPLRGVQGGLCVAVAGSKCSVRLAAKMATGHPDWQSPQDISLCHNGCDGRPCGVAWRGRDMIAAENLASLLLTDRVEGCVWDAVGCLSKQGVGFTLVWPRLHIYTYPIFL
ncbi:hypothetical protein E2C01_004998 [Portunus trituberculatus]|uniref:Uncharacterized protein n=1 Tax=Portunus trituberculatus TaxID=210409 RepID=A0A5B7CRG9_PORTR|nr:hypothetical protein [Portunus trituberculatus]